MSFSRAFGTAIQPYRGLYISYNRHSSDLQPITPPSAIMASKPSYGRRGRYHSLEKHKGESKVTTQNPVSVAPHSDPTPAKPAETLTDEERERIREYYRSLNFKEFLAACPIDGIDLTRDFEYPREVEL